MLCGWQFRNSSLSLLSSILMVSFSHSSRGISSLPVLADTDDVDIQAKAAGEGGH